MPEIFKNSVREMKKKNACRKDMAEERIQAIVHINRKLRNLKAKRTKIGEK